MPTLRRKKPTRHRRPLLQTLPLSKLAPAKVRRTSACFTYRISTRSPECQAHFDQGLGYFYNYVWRCRPLVRDGRKIDPDCAWRGGA